MNNLSPLLQLVDPALVRVQSDLSSAKKLLQEMAQLLAQPLQPSTEENVEKSVYHSLLEREKLGNTGIGNGVALPHSRYSETKRAILAIITLKNPIDYDSADGQAVDVAFGLLVPQEATQDHLNLLAEIARFMSSNNSKEKLLSAETPIEVMALIEDWSESQVAQ